MASEIAKLLIAEIEKRYSDRQPHFGSDPEPVVVFPAKHPEVGDAQIWDDGDEIRIHIGEIAHGHFAFYEDGFSEKQRAECITGKVVEFLDALFQDRVVLWEGPCGAGGTRQVPQKRCFDRRWFPIGRTYVWSKPLRRKSRSSRRTG